jgi:2-methylfumaryl-CoA isomerase
MSNSTFSIVFPGQGSQAVGMGQDLYQEYDAVREIFDAAKLTWSEFRTVKEAVLGDPDLSVANPIFRDLVQEGLGRFPVPGHAADFSGLEREAPRAAPVLGAHTEEILSEVTGLDDGEIARLFDRGIVAAPNRCGRAEATVLSD